MSYDLRVWERPVGQADPVSFEEASRTLLELERLEPGPNPKFIALAEQMATRYPVMGQESAVERNDDSDAVWISDPVAGARNCTSAVWAFELPTEDHVHALRFVVERANALGLTVFDDQLGMVFISPDRVLPPEQAVIREGAKRDSAYPKIEYRYTENVYREALGISERDYDSVIDGNGNIYAYAAKALFHNGWNFFTAGFVDRQSDRYAGLSNGDISASQYWNATGIDGVTSVAAIGAAGMAGSRVAGVAGSGFFGEFASSAAGGITYSLIQKAGEVATYNFTQDARQRIPSLGTSLDKATADYLSAANLTQLAADVVLDSGLGWLMGWAGSRSNLRAMHNSPNTVNPTKIKVVEPQLAADPFGLRGSTADSSGSRILAAAGGELKTYSGQSIALPARASKTLDEALAWMQQEGARMDQYVNKNAAAMEQALQAVRMQENILLAMRNSLKDGNAIASLNALHPIKSFDQLKQQLGKESSGDALWAKVAEAAKKNTEKQAVGCFVAGTLVHTREGLRPIEQIKVGDYVLSKPESGEGETAYKRVVNTFEFEDRETWFVSWSDHSLLPRLKTDLTPEQYIEAHGQSFVVTTPNHPFWVVASDEEELRWHESHIDIGPPFPQQQWVRADHLAAGMTLLLPDGRVVNVWRSERVYKTDGASQGWIDLQGDGTEGLAIDFSDQNIQPCVPIHDYRRQPLPGQDICAGYVYNPNVSHCNDLWFRPHPESWYLRKVYNLEVEDYHTYFVDKLGVWVHNTNCGAERLAKVQQVYTEINEFNNYVKDLPDAELKGVRLVPDGKVEQLERLEDNWAGVQYNTHGAVYDPKSKELFAYAVLGKSPFMKPLGAGGQPAELYGKHGDALAHIDAGNGTALVMAATMDGKGGKFGVRTNDFYQYTKRDFDWVTASDGLEESLKAFVKDLKTISSRIARGSVPAHVYAVQDAAGVPSEFAAGQPPRQKTILAYTKRGVRTT